MEGHSGGQTVGRLEDRTAGPRGDRWVGRKVDPRGDCLEGKTVEAKAAWRRSQPELLPVGKSMALLQQGRRQAKKRALTA